MACQRAGRGGRAAFSQKGCITDAAIHASVPRPPPHDSPPRLQVGRGAGRGVGHGRVAGRVAGGRRRQRNATATYRIPHFGYAPKDNECPFGHRAPCLRRVSLGARAGAAGRAVIFAPALVWGDGRERDVRKREHSGRCSATRNSSQGARSRSRKDRPVLSLPLLPLLLPPLPLLLPPLPLLRGRRRMGGEDEEAPRRRKEGRAAAGGAGYAHRAHQ